MWSEILLLFVCSAMFRIVLIPIEGTLCTVFGEWKKGVNAGGQIGKNSFASNPQYLLNITGEIFLMHIYVCLW